MPTINVKVPDEYADRRVILAEYDEQHPNDTHEIYIVGYPGEPNTYEVGETAGVLGKIAAGELVELGSRRRAQPRDEPEKPEARTEVKPEEKRRT